MSLNIKKQIKKHGLEAKEVARRLGITPVAFSQSINGNPTVAALERYAKAIGCRVSDFFEEESDSFVALVRVGTKAYHVDSLDELERLVLDLRREQMRKAGQQGENAVSELQ